MAAIDVILYPLSHRLWIPSLGYKKSSSTTWGEQEYLKPCEIAILLEKQMNGNGESTHILSALLSLIG